MYIFLFIILIIIILIILSRNQGKPVSRASFYMTQDELDELKKKKELAQNNSGTTENNLTAHSRYKILSHEEWIEFRNNPINIEHFANISAATKIYSKITKEKKYFGADAQSVISILQRDIAIADSFISLYHKYNQELPPNYYSFKTLAILYEKRMQYEDAIAVCTKAINVGYSDDGTKGGMSARISRLQKLQSALTD